MGGAGLRSRALYGAAREPFLGCSVQPTELARLLAWTWAGDGKGRSLHLRSCCEIKLCLDTQSLA